MSLAIEAPECACSRHSGECGCPHCHFEHDHDWRTWAVYPTCEFCQQEILEWVEDFEPGASRGRFVPNQFKGGLKWIQR